MFKTWDGVDATASATGNAGCAYVVNSSTGQPYGDSNVGWKNYADLSNYDKLIIVATAGTPRVMMNRTIDNGNFNDDKSKSNLLEMPKNGTWSDDYYSKEGNVYTYNLAKIVADFGFAHLNAIKGANWGNVLVTGMYLFKDSDPLGLYKEALEEAIKNGKAQYAFGKTEASFSALTQAISDGENALAAAESKDALESATAAINDAISGLVIADGYEPLTKDMFKKWNGSDADATAEGASTVGALNLNTTIGNGGVLYGPGAGNVYWSDYADLTDYGKIYFVGTPGVKVRCLFNRIKGDGEGGAYVEKVIDVNGKGVAEFNLTSLTDGYAHLNTVKLPGGGKFTDILLTKATSVPVTVGSTGYATFSSKKAVDFTSSSIKAYTATVSGSDITFTRINQVPANTGVLLWAEDVVEENVPIVELGGDPAAIQNNLVANATAMNGTALSGKYILAENNGEVSFFPAGSSASLAAGKAYLEVPTDARIILPGSEATGINAVEAAQAEAPVYNLQGQRVMKAAKGVNIKGGKKFIVR